MNEIEGEGERSAWWLSLAMNENFETAQKELIRHLILSEVWMANAALQQKQKWMSSMVGGCHTALAYKRSQAQIPL